MLFPSNNGNTDMILKAGFALCMVWLLAPQVSGAAPSAANCAATGLCSFAQGSDARRIEIMTRLGEIRAELRQARHG
jgi:hypothetical protein